MIIIIGLITLNFSINSYAGGSGSHGGNATVCFKDPRFAKKINSMSKENKHIPNEFLSEITLVKPLDLYETETHGSDFNEDEQKNFELLTLLPEESRLHFLKRISDRLKIVSPQTSKQLNQTIELYRTRTYFHPKQKGMVGITQVYDVQDLPYMIDTEYCVIATIASQRGVGSQSRLDIDMRLFNLIPTEFEKNVILLHEMIFKLYADNQSIHVQSESVRKLTALLLRKKITKNDLCYLMESIDPNSGACDHLRTEIKRQLIEALYADPRHRNFAESSDYFSFVDGLMTTLKSGKCWSNISRYSTIKERIKEEAEIYLFPKTAQIYAPEPTYDWLPDCNNFHL